MYPLFLHFNPAINNYVHSSKRFVLKPSYDTCSIYMWYIQLINGTAGVATPRSMVPSDAIEFSQHFWSTCFLFNTRKPLKMPPYTNIVIAFPPTVWAMIFVTTGVFAVTFMIFFRASIFLTKTEHIIYLNIYFFRPTKFLPVEKFLQTSLTLLLLFLLLHLLLNHMICHGLPKTLLVKQILD